MSYSYTAIYIYYPLCYSVHLELAVILLEILIFDFFDILDLYSSFRVIRIFILLLVLLLDSIDFVS